ncbi:MAG: hypothetical protein A3G26_02165 [Betaproteobacteria bacterium RIFCSPLOWO2_12_FULL_65_110]|nr:MAG: hypothetical protein A3G26_02165 [Betaproteobacteria bacterium RIFCSPLOWO2_12_FULL_65_110]
MATDYERTKRDIAQLLAHSEVFPDHVEVEPRDTNAHTLFLRAHWMVHGQDKDRRSVPIRFAIDGRVIVELAKFNAAQRKLFEEHFLHFVANRMRDYDVESGAPKAGNSSAFDIIFDEDGMKSFYDALAKLPQT